MKLTNKDLRRIIKEELSHVLSEKIKIKRSDRARQEVESYLINLWNAITASSNSEQLKEGVSFWGNRGQHLQNFTIGDALDQLSGNQVQIGDEMAKPWRFLTLSGQAQLTKQIGTSLSMYSSDLFKGKITPKLIRMELYLDRSGDFSFIMNSAGISGVELDELMKIEGQNLSNNLTEVLSYYTLEAYDLFELANSLYTTLTIDNLPKTSLP